MIFEALTYIWFVTPTIGYQVATHTDTHAKFGVMAAREEVGTGKVVGWYLNYGHPTSTDNTSVTLGTYNQGLTWGDTYFTPVFAELSRFEDGSWSAMVGPRFPLLSAGFGIHNNEFNLMFRVELP